MSHPHPTPHSYASHTKLSGAGVPAGFLTLSHIAWLQGFALKPKLKPPSLCNFCILQNMHCRGLLLSQVVTELLLTTVIAALGFLWGFSNLLNAIKVPRRCTKCIPNSSQMRLLFFMLLSLQWVEFPYVFRCPICPDAKFLAAFLMLVFFSETVVWGLGRWLSE